ncbi:class I SAM-dependent methyltransferase [Rubripirellula amarantea]|uniref:Methyltransferase domain protein n=1 Tax=Rubripirellula amarantea TaxID=2527999 RepID=A0A5C5WTU0_9BACT|nr:class I SAM-dependent methyltransferase [Rubripirellula amarantea]MDA8745075.1 class I SAM-dependent methyltransferase [Rubripirellula amarantea]TWT53940.1 Methyltransferase domain protein [Rubripirellula amarantea]
MNRTKKPASKPAKVSAIKQNSVFDETPPPNPQNLAVLDESIYDHPKYYDLVFGADCAAEIKFILACGEAHLRGGSIKRLFEPACGTGRLIQAFAKKGFEVSGLDLNPHAVAFCNARFRRHGFPESAFVADMADFKVKRKSDIAFNTINSFRHLNSERAARDHLNCMAQAVRKGGLYLLGVHLTPTDVAPSETESWSARRGHLSINTHMWTVGRDPKSRVERFGIYFDVHRPSESFRIIDELVLRSYTPKQMDSLIESSDGWEVIETYDFSYELDEPIEVDSTTEDVVYVMRRK